MGEPALPQKIPALGGALFLHESGRRRVLGAAVDWLVSAWEALEGEQVEVFFCGLFVLLGRLVAVLV